MSHLDTSGEFFTDRVAVVTGGASGIGLAITKKLVKNGARVAVWDIDAGQLEGCRAALQDRVIAQKVDVAHRDSVDAAASAVRAAWGEMDHLVNNAGIIGPRGPVAAIEDSSLDRVIAVNIKSLFHVTSAFVSQGTARDHRSILNMSSIAMWTGSAPGNVAYAMTKGAVASFTVALAKELAPAMRVNALAPGSVDTGLQNNVFDSAGAKNIISQIPLRRMGSPDEIAEAAVWLLSRQSSYVTGAILTVAGGR